MTQRAFLSRFLLIILPGLFIISACQSPSVTTYSVQIIAEFSNPAEMPSVFITGNQPELGNWNPGRIPMSRQSPHTYSYSGTFPAGTDLQFKITGGSWWTEAAGPDGLPYENYQLIVTRDTTITIPVSGWMNRMENGTPVIDLNRFQRGNQLLQLSEFWRYHPEDSVVFSSPAYNDHRWDSLDVTMSGVDWNGPGWKGTGWFRFHFIADSTLFNTTLALSLNQTGAAEIWYNGRLLYQYGSIEPNGTITPTMMTWWQPIRIDAVRHQLFAVRYANDQVRQRITEGFFPGFRINFTSIENAFRNAVEIRQRSELQTAFILIPLILFIVHLFLYGFNRNQRQNLFYALCMAGFAALTFFNYYRELIVDLDMINLYVHLSLVSATITILFGLLTVQQMSDGKLTFRSWLAIGIAFALIVATFSGFRATEISIGNYLFFGLTLIDDIHMFLKGKKRSDPSSLIPITGFLVLSVFISLQILVDFNWLPVNTWTKQMYVYGMIALALSMSVYLAWQFSRVNRDLEEQLNQVRQLSEAAILQEREKVAMEIRQAVVEVENNRRRTELEEARKLQLSLLPATLPSIHGVTLEASMLTATEVGGDYYDWFTGPDGSVTVAIGDATGHGLKAGFMVSATKGLLNLLNSLENLTDILAKSNQSLRSLNLRLLTMCLALMRFDKKQVTFTSAGMPPVFWYHAKTGICERLTLKAMPLGAVASFPYELISFQPLPGDCFVLSSDGLFEMFNPVNEQFGMENIENSITRLMEASTDNLADRLLSEARDWASGFPLADDVTVVVIRWNA